MSDTDRIQALIDEARSICTGMAESMPRGEVRESFLRGEGADRKSALLLLLTNELERLTSHQRTNDSLQVGDQVRLTGAEWQKFGIWNAIVPVTGIETPSNDVRTPVITYGTETYHVYTTDVEDYSVERIEP